MKVKIILTGPGGELATVTLHDLTGEDDPAISEAVATIAANGVQAGDTITITEIE